MISFRYHIVSIVSVFLALAIGIALGGGPLKGEVDNTLVEQVEADRQTKADLQSEIASLRAGNTFTDAFADSVAPRLIGGSLQGRPVTLVVLPGAQDTVVTSLTELIGNAGGSVGATLRASEGLVDVGQKQLIDELGRQLLDDTSDVSVPDNASAYERLGALLARAVATDQDAGAPVDDTANSILSGLSTAGLLSPTDDPARRGSLVVFVAGAGGGTDEEQQGAAAIVVALSKAIDADSDGVVVAGPIPSAREGGVVDAVRRDVIANRNVSTVDVLGRTAGQVVTVMALADQKDGSTGHYGAVDAESGAVPSGPGGGGPAGQ